MAETIAEEKAATKDQWHKRIAEQERSGMSVRRFCKEHGIGEHVFYYWRKRLRRQQEPVRFALVDRRAEELATDARLELVLATGERLRIGAGADEATLRTVLEALRR
jgi:transposase-like protein